MTTEQIAISDAGQWTAIARALDTTTCDAIIDRCQHFDATTPEVVGQEFLPNHRAGISRPLPRCTETEELYKVVWDIGELLNRLHFGLDLTEIIKSPEYVEYSSGKGHFDWHNDYGLESPISKRKLTVSIQLSDSSDYDGGDFLVFGSQQPLPRSRGSVIALPAYVHHQITPVTAGTRRALVGWLAGPCLR